MTSWEGRSGFPCGPWARRSEADAGTKKKGYGTANGRPWWPARRGRGLGKAAKQPWKGPSKGLSDAGSRQMGIEPGGTYGYNGGSVRGGVAAWGENLRDGWI